MHSYTQGGRYSEDKNKTRIEDILPLSISIRNLPPPIILIIRRWCSVPGAEARGSLCCIPSGIM